MDESRPKAWLEIALQRSVVQRSLAYGIVVGAILILINHGDAILIGQVDAARVARMALTVVVPYVVSTLSSIGATRALRR